MDAAELRYRISEEGRELKEKYRRVYKERERLWEQAAQRIEYEDELDERHLAQGQSVRSAHNTHRRGMHRLFRAYASVIHGSWGDHDKQSHENTHNLFWGPRIEQYFKERTPGKPIREEVRASQNRMDIRDNFLYAEWVKQLSRKDAILTFPVYALYTCIKAAIILITERPLAFDELGIEYGAENRSNLIRWKESEGYDLSDVELVIGLGVLHDGLLPVAEQLMLRYGDFVRVERHRLDNEGKDVADSPLPDDPYDKSLPQRYVFPPEIVLEHAVQGYMAGEGRADVVADRYGVPQKFFRQVLRKRGLIADHGGDRKGKSVE